MIKTKRERSVNRRVKLTLTIKKELRKAIPKEWNLSYMLEQIIEQKLKRIKND